MRMSYQRQKEVLEMPNLIEVQKDSYQWFLDEGLKEVFDDISPIADYGGKLSLEFIDFTYDEKDAKYSIEQCKERDVTYAAPLKVRVRLINKETEEINEHEIFMGDLPLMTATGTFVINGAERVIVSQLVRSPGIYYAIAHDKLGKRLFSSTVIPNRGAWLEYETDSNDVFYVRVDRTRKVPITVLIRALGIGTNAEIIDLFGEEPKILASFTKDTSTNYQEGLLELYKKNDKDLRFKFWFSNVDNKGEFFYDENTYCYIQTTPNYNIGVPEMMLIKAEALARQNDPAALDILNELRKYRFTEEDYTALTAEDGNSLLEIVLEERRRELALSGLRWFDMKRLVQDGIYTQTLTRTSPDGETHTLAPGSNRYLFPIPQSVILQNGNIVQNPR